MQKKNSLPIYFHIHLVSDGTGETLVGIMKASSAQFDNAIALDHLHPLVRKTNDLDQVLAHIEAYPGIVLYTLFSNDNRKRLEKFCTDLNLPVLSMLDSSLSLISRYLGRDTSNIVGAQHVLDSNYYQRIDALNYSMAHDDGQLISGLKLADIVLLGVSRTSKTPTSMYLANRGFKVGNIPIIPNMSLPPILKELDKPLIVGLIAQPDRIIQIRQQRLNSLDEMSETDYIDKTKVRQEMREAQRLFLRHNYPVVDVTQRSVEETAAKIISLYQNKEKS